MTQRAFVTGATGFLGQNLARELLSQGWQVSTIARPTSDLQDLEGLDIEIARGDITDPDSLAAAIPRNVDAVFHVAASTSVWSGNNESQTRINVGGTRNMLAAASDAGAGRFIHTSTFAVWGFPDGRFDEDTPWAEGNEWINYVRTKREAERLVRDAASNGTDAVILNPGHIMGPGDRHNWSRMFRMIAQGKLPGVPPGGGSFGDVREIAKAHIRAFSVGTPGRNYLLGGTDASMLEVVQIAGELLGQKVPAKASPGWLLRAVGRVNAIVASLTGREPDLTPEGAAMITSHMQCDSSRAIEELGYGFTPIRTLLEDSCNWLREKGLLG